MDKLIDFVIKNISSLNLFQIILLLILGAGIGVGMFLFFQWLFRERLEAAEKLVELKEKAMYELSRNVKALDIERQQLSRQIQEYEAALKDISVQTDAQKKDLAIERANVFAMKLLLSSAMQLLFYTTINLNIDSMIIQYESNFKRFEDILGPFDIAEITRKLSETSSQLSSFTDKLHDIAWAAVNIERGLIKIDNKVLSIDIKPIKAVLDEQRNILNARWESALNKLNKAIKN